MPFKLKERSISTKLNDQLYLKCNFLPVKNTMVVIGRFPLDQKFRNFRNGDKWYGNFPGKVPENPEIVEFPKSEPFNRKFWKFRDENQMERKFPVKYVRKFGYTSRGCPLFRKLCKFAISYSSALVLLAATTASWTSHARMTATGIRKLKYFTIFPLICR